MSNQSRLESLLEQILNVGSGFLLSLIVWVSIIKPVFNIHTSLWDNLTITLIFTGISVTRGYVWRRLFEKRRV